MSNSPEMKKKLSKCCFEVRIIKATWTEDNNLKRHTTSLKLQEKKALLLVSLTGFALHSFFPCILSRMFRACFCHAHWSRINTNKQVTDLVFRDEQINCFVRLLVCYVIVFLLLLQILLQFNACVSRRLTLCCLAQWQSHWAGHAAHIHVWVSKLSGGVCPAEEMKYWMLATVRESLWLCIIRKTEIVLDINCQIF